MEKELEASSEAGELAGILEVEPVVVVVGDAELRE